MMWRPLVCNLLLACVLWGVPGCGGLRPAPIRAAPPLAEDLLRAQAEDDCRFYRLQPSPAPSREETCIQSRIEAMQAIAAMQSDPDFAAAQQACAFFRGSPREDVCYRTRLGRTPLAPHRVARILPAEGVAQECSYVNGTYTCVPTTRRSTVMTRVNPDGSYTFIVPQKVPSGGSTGPCGVDVTDIRTVDAARDTYGTLLGTLRLDPNNVACRQALAVVGRRAGVSEAAIANDLNASVGGLGSPVPPPSPSEPAPKAGTSQ